MKKLVIIHANTYLSVCFYSLVADSFISLICEIFVKPFLRRPVKHPDFQSGGRGFEAVTFFFMVHVFTDFLLVVILGGHDTIIISQ